MSVIDVCQKYCIGCGLCKSENGVKMHIGEKGFLQPKFEKTAENRDFLENVCPINDLHQKEENEYPVWGSTQGVYAAYAKNAEIRKMASSGGVLTALAIFLLEKKYVDGIIHVIADKSVPTETKCRISTTREEILEGCGSRYSISSPWSELSQMVDKKKKYAAIGKPCDIKALRKLKESTGKYENIVCLFSFFCAGMPSKQANERLLNGLGCGREKCQTLTYRGNGWPGYATATDREGKQYTMEYSKAWGQILGRDVHPYCRICFDGIGEAADIACGDGWYIAENGMPDFSERDGRNVVFVRTKAGEMIYNAAQTEGYIDSHGWEDEEQLKVIQKYQFTRRATMKDKLVAYRLFLRGTPKYDKKKVNFLSKKIGSKEHCKVFLGTVKRIVQKKI